MNITEDFFGADFKESDFPGLYAQHSRKPHTPRRRVNISDDVSPGKKLKAARMRSQSQSSQDSEKDVSEVKEEPISPSKNKERKRSIDSQKKPKASLNITKTLSELDSKEKKLDDETNKDVSMDIDDSDDDIGKNKTSITNKNSAASKKRRLKQFRRSLLESDDESKEEETVPQVTEKPGNEVEVVDDNSNKNTNNDVDDYDESNENEASAIFVPPVASGMKKISEVTAHNKDRPPSEIFLKELKKFCRDAIRSGCVSLAELKEVLALRQKGKKSQEMSILYIISSQVFYSTLVNITLVLIHSTELSCLKMDELQQYQHSIQSSIHQYSLILLPIQNFNLSV